MVNSNNARRRPIVGNGLGTTSFIGHRQMNIGLSCCNFQSTLQYYCACSFTSTCSPCMLLVAQQKWQHSAVCLFYTVSQKSSQFKLSVTLSNLNRFSKFFYSWKAYKICYKTHATLPTFLHYLAKLKIQNFCRYSADNGRKCKQVTFLSPLTFYWSTNFNIFGI